MWLNRAKKVCNTRSLELKDAKLMCMYREQWRIFVNGTNSGVNA